MKLYTRGKSRKEILHNTKGGKHHNQRIITKLNFKKKKEKIIKELGGNNDSRRRGRHLKQSAKK